MRKNVGDRLPKFTEEEKSNFKKYKIDFMGINHYTSRFLIFFIFILFYLFYISILFFNFF